MGAYTLLQDLTVATNSTSVVLNDFGTITKDDFVKIVFYQGATSGNNVVELFANTAISSSNYHIQVLRGFGSSTLAVRANVNHLFNNTAQATNIAYLKLSENDRLNMFNNSTQSDSSDVGVDFRYTTSSGATFTSGITSLTLTATTTNGIGTGSRIQIYKLAAQKVADFTVASNTTQVDISSLSIDKDSEYLLVSDMFFTTATSPLLEVNNNNSSSNYYSQAVFGIGSSAFADRINNAWALGYTNGNARTLTHSHIKLSNIGAYTSQNYCLREVGSSSIGLQNSFVSSTAENITSITAINVRAQNTNAIGAGSRFTLYKLYE